MDAPTETWTPFASRSSLPGTAAHYNRLMQFLSLSRRRTDDFPPQAFTPERIAAETHRVKELYEAGILRQIWARGDAGGAAILWEAVSELEVRTAAESLPLFKSGMLEIVFLIPLKQYAGFFPPK